MRLLTGLLNVLMIKLPRVVKVSAQEYDFYKRCQGMFTTEKMNAYIFRREFLFERIRRVRFNPYKVTGQLRKFTFDYLKFATNHGTEMMEAEKRKKNAEKGKNSDYMYYLGKCIVRGTLDIWPASDYPFEEFFNGIFFEKHPEFAHLWPKQRRQ